MSFKVNYLETTIATTVLIIAYTFKLKFRKMILFQILISQEIEDVMVYFTDEEHNFSDQQPKR